MAVLLFSSHAISMNMRKKLLKELNDEFFQFRQIEGLVHEERQIAVRFYVIYKRIIDANQFSL